MSEKFAKIIDTKDGSQVLFTKEYNAEDEFVIKATTEVGDLRMSINLCYTDVEERNEKFNDLNNEDALKIRNITTDLAS